MPLGFLPAAGKLASSLPELTTQSSSLLLKCARLAPIPNRWLNLDTLCTSFKRAATARRSCRTQARTPLAPRETAVSTCLNVWVASTYLMNHRSPSIIPGPLITFVPLAKSSAFCWRDVSGRAGSACACSTGSTIHLKLSWECVVSATCGTHAL